MIRYSINASANEYAGRAGTGMSEEGADCLTCTAIYAGLAIARCSIVAVADPVIRRGP